jgi:hypothetical protein
MAMLGLTARHLILCVVLPYLFPSTPHIYGVIVRLQAPFSRISNRIFAQTGRNEARQASAPAVIIRALDSSRQPDI